MSIVRTFALILSLSAIAFAADMPASAASLPKTSAQVHTAKGSATSSIRPRS